MSEVQQPLNKSAFENALKSRSLTQATLAEKIGANPKSFSRWVNEGQIQTKYLWDLADALNLSEDELGEILMVPKYEVFFRRKFLGEVPREVCEHAIELAKTLFRLTYLNSKTQFCPPNASKVQDPVEIANQIKKHTGIEGFRSLTAIIASLAEQGVEVAVIPFDKMKVQSVDELEKAFSVTDGKRCLIFLDANVPEEHIIFNLCHELSHLFRPDIEHAKAEETFCNDVATELVYPRSFFESHKEIISKIIESRSVEAIINLVHAIQEKLGGEPMGIVLRLRGLNLLSKKDLLHKRVFGFANKSVEVLKKQSAEASLFKRFEPNNRSKFLTFWNDDSLNRDSSLRFFMHVKNGATDETISPRRFAELFNADVSTVDEMIQDWRRKLQTSLAQATNE